MFLKEIGKLNIKEFFLKKLFKSLHYKYTIRQFYVFSYVLFSELWTAANPTEKIQKTDFTNVYLDIKLFNIYTNDSQDVYSLAHCSFSFQSQNQQVSLSSFFFSCEWNKMPAKVN